MARTPLTPVSLVAGEGTAPGAATTIDGALVTAGITIPTDGRTHRLMLRITNTAAAAKLVTFPAGDDYFAHRGGAGDLTISVPPSGATRVIAGIESSRITQAAGAVYVDFEAGFTGEISAELAPWPTP